MMKDKNKTDAEVVLSSSNGKCYTEYLSYNDKVIQPFCKKHSIYLNNDVSDIVKNMMWACEKFISNITKIKNKQINIFVHDVGDPDAFASAKALGELFLMHGANDYRILCGKIGHPQNVEMIQLCNVVIFPPDHRFENGVNCLVDVSPPLGTRNTQNVIDPPKDIYFVCDHHDEQVTIIEACKNEGIKSVFIPLIGKRVGAVSTLIILMALCLKQLENIVPETRAALLLGIYTDTSGMIHNVTTLDSALFNMLNTGKAAEIFSALQFYAYPDDWLELKHRAYINQFKMGKIRLTTTGLTPDYCRDVIAECANDVIRQKDTAMAFCLAITMNGLELSIRANSRLLKLEPDRIINIVEQMFNELFPGKSGFKFSKIFPHNVEGGACVKLEPIDRIFLEIKDMKPDYNRKEIQDKSLNRCKEYIFAIVKVLQNMANNDHELMAGLDLENSKDVI